MKLARHLDEQLKAMRTSVHRCMRCSSFSFLINDVNVQNLECPSAPQHEKKLRLT